MLRFEQGLLRFDDFTLEADFEVAKGDRLAVLGASGSGKSTLLSAIAGFLTLDRGRVIVEGVDVTRTPAPKRPLSILFQEGNLFPHLSAFDNVALGLRTDLRLDDETRSRVHEALARVGLAEMSARKPGDLSGGQRSRVALARMLLRGKPLALLDEPFAALDPGLRAEMLALMGELCADTGLTLVMVSHDLRDAERLCSHLLLLEKGRVVLQGAMADVLRDPPEILRPWM